MNEIEDKVTVTERVLTGIEYLDETYPGWRERFDLGTFKISSVFYCVLAQVHRTNYMATPEVQEQSHDWLMGHGFSGPICNPDYWETLQAEWERLLAGVVSADV